MLPKLHDSDNVLVSDLEKNALCLFFRENGLNNFAER